MSLRRGVKRPPSRKSLVHREVFWTNLRIESRNQVDTQSALRCRVAMCMYTCTCTCTCACTCACACMSGVHTYPASTPHVHVHVPPSSIHALQILHDAVSCSSSTAPPRVYRPSRRLSRLQLIAHEHHASFNWPITFSTANSKSTRPRAQNTIPQPRVDMPTSRWSVL